MDSGTTKGTSEFVAVAGLGEGYDGVGDGGTNVGAHDDEDGWSDRENWIDKIQI